jgi:DNA-binding CsgD family transcriptional regulator
MSEPGPRVAAWFGIIADLLGDPLYEMPHQLILEQLAQTFSVTGLGHSSSDSLGHQQLILHPRELLTPFGELDEWLNGRSHEHHPLLRWHAVTRDPRPTTMERVPTALVPTRDRQPLISGLKRFGVEQQVAISYRLSGASHQAYVLGRARTDFSDDDVVVARYVQRALIGLDRQVSMIRQLSGLQSAVVDLGLTARETSVLALLAAGYPNRGIARRLGCAPRTVEKHLERIFRKLGVRDKLNAVRVAQAWNLVAGRSADSQQSVR